MTYSANDFMYSVLDALGIETDSDDVGAQADLCLVRIEALLTAANGLIALRKVAVWDEDSDRAEFDSASAKAEAGYLALRDAGMFGGKVKSMTYEQRARSAEKLLRAARDLLLDAGASRAVVKVRVALRSCNGAVRAASYRDHHARGLVQSSK